ncbi:MAG: 3-hydroxybutyryl-CoA dehydrogenase [Pseudomonadota bacterium]|nr:3-hydroxybutyryl-CoA dehydrogenase [Pseudomonadota bacterium]
MERSSVVGVVGAGTMGNGIAQAFAGAGYRVLMYDISEAALARGRAAIENSLGKLVHKEKIKPDERDAILRRVEPVTTLSAFKDCRVVIEAATENASVKADLFRKLDEVCATEAILATNTSSISITKVASITKRPQRVIGMHFFNPVPVMKLVEVIRARQTADEVHAEILALCRELGKTPVEVRNSPGFVANRIVLPMINEAIYTYSEGLASAEDIDTTLKLGMGHPMGPLALADLIGLDTCLSIMEVLADGFRDSKYRPCPLLKEMVEAGDLGRKTGKGFYTYV